MAAPGQRKYNKNAGLISLKEIDDDKYIVGACIVLMDEAGNYSTEFVKVSLDGIPEPETQELVGGMTATAFEVANLRTA